MPLFMVYVYNIAAFSKSTLSSVHQGLRLFLMRYDAYVIYRQKKCSSFPKIAYYYGRNSQPELQDLAERTRNGALYLKHISEQA